MPHPIATESQARLLARIAAAATLDDQLALTAALSAAEQAGYDSASLYEAVLQLVIYLGYPRTIHALVSFNTLFPTYMTERDPAPTERWSAHAALVWPDRGATIFQQLWGPDALSKNRLDEFSPELAEWVLCDAFGRIFGREGLTLMEREALVLGTLVAQNATRELMTHRRALLHLGGHEGLLDAIVEGVQDLIPAEAYIRAKDTLATLRGDGLETSG